ncbi:MAG TPA: HD domain-containing phosphohydrolase, partial [Longimicrobiales bacterium]|nr:HD domain-containing phosphohydrolase [Longimicrobiales bacterium]
RILRAAFQLSAARRNQVRLMSEVDRYQKELADLNRIGMALMTERDHDALLREILRHVMRLTGSDAGAVYLAERHDDGSASLRFELVLAESVTPNAVFYQQVVPMDSSSLAGHAAKTRQPVVVEDIRNLPVDAPYAVNPFAERYGYWIKSMLTIPMIDQRDEVMGVLQLANRKSAPNVRILSKEDAHRYERFRSVVRAADQPAVLAGKTSELLADIANHTFERPDGRIAPYLEPDELHYLRIPRGSLDEEERLEIEAHAIQTFEFLSSIAWTDDLKDIATYASSHHEKLDGSGYPNQLRGKSVSVQTRMLGIADIFDALTAADRPYKPAVSADRALDIIQAEVVAGRLDGEISQVMIASGVYRRILEEDWRQF